MLPLLSSNYSRMFLDLSSASTIEHSIQQTIFITTHCNSFIVIQNWDNVLSIMIRYNVSMIAMEFPNTNPLGVVMALNNTIGYLCLFVITHKYIFLILQVLWCASDLQ